MSKPRARAIMLLVSIATTAAVAALIIHDMNAANARIRIYKDLQACVTRAAHAQGYHGNPAGFEAWDLFADECLDSRKK